MDKLRAYISHTIRGRQGVGATDEQRKENSNKAIAFGNLLRDEFPMVDFYIPGECCEMDTILIRENYLLEDQILEIDCTIISRCNFIIVFSPGDYISRGMQIEIDHAVKSHIPVISAIDGSYKEYVKRIVYAINCHLISMLR